MTIEVEAPEIVTVKLTLPDGTPLTILFTRAEYTSIQIAARAHGLTVDQWVIERALVVAADPRGLALLGGN